ncbi:MATE family efflux transporter [Megalodesulfovibrio gigas]|uniref:Multidrug-efflux transporter n=1 Tax=Megalodesulfovibrio gigas (strain ATCC 19364 / DSM 1382 / NCIMB 9332 / VKM B-1759) TaxID=1121448 RepID=T2GEM6_MEGG1|nr:MATE family efflux transporter [Megalodesulfovibrio gigas]AGW14609.1 putative MATE efflux family protein [Megalodesulfovibrio gigas DSM 1382 = ATCC 19364]
MNHAAARPAPRPALHSWQAILRLTWPQMLMMFAHFSVGFVDVWTAGMIGPQTQAALGLITQSLFVLLIICVGLSNGVVAAVSQSLGARRPMRAMRYGVYSLVTAAGVGVLLMAVGLPSRDLFLSLLNTPDDVRPEAARLLVIYLATLPAQHLLVVTNAIFRAYGEVRTPLWTVTVLALVNLLGDLTLGLGWGLGWLGVSGWGATGLGLATLFSVSLGAGLNCWVLWKRGRLHWRAMPPRRWQRRARGYLLRVSWPAGASQVVWQVGNLALFVVLGLLGDQAMPAMAGFGAGQRLEALLFLPAMAFNMSASVLVGQHLGAGDVAAARRSGLQLLALGCGSISLAGFLLWQVAGTVTGWVAADAVVHIEVLSYLYWNILAICFTTGTMILAGVMTGAGATLYTLGVLAVATWGVRLPLAYWLAVPAGWGAQGVWIAMFASQGVQCGALLALFLFRDWSRFAMRPVRRNHPQPATKGETSS